jgi:ribose 5-phosphate isomerase B
MIVAIAADHAGFPLKQRVLELVRAMGHQTIDLGTDSTSAVYYPDCAHALASAILDGRAQRGILLCGSGVGACVAANKFDGIRAGTCHDTFSAHQSVEDDDANVLCLGARIIGPEMVAELVPVFLRAQFSGAERHVRRLRKIASFESKL